ncbi:MAG: hypothetical protein M0Z66_09505 [Thermaerobacter sp.]|nr:hypothetical protein [Thermaerobacter sp.]
MRRVRSRPGPVQAAWVDVYRALRHRTLNRLQVAHGWAQLGEGDAAREALEEYLLEEQRLSALLSSASGRQQRALLTLLAHCERKGRPVRLTGTAQTLGPAAIADMLGDLQRAVRSGDGAPIEIALAGGAVRVLLHGVGGS